MNLELICAFATVLIVISISYSARGPWWILYVSSLLASFLFGFVFHWWISRV